MIYSWAKNLNTTPEHILYDMGYQNLLMYSMATPHYDDVKDDWDDSIDANNPDNFNKNNNYDEEEFIR